MDTQSIGATYPVPKSSRHERGVILAREKFEEFEKIGRFTWSVPSCKETSVRYLVTYRPSRNVVVCSCEDFIRGCGERKCKHIIAVAYIRAMSAGCAGCGDRRWMRDLIELHEDNHDNLTYFHGDMLCHTCARDGGVL